jgi:hypothetical protein
VVLNFEVAGAHNYYVEGGALAHNSADDCVSAVRGIGTALRTYWPPNRGFAGTPMPTTLGIGTLIDRYGTELGTFASPRGTPFGLRSLPPAAESGPFRAYEVIRPLPAQSGVAAPWFGLGGGIQYEFAHSIEVLPNVVDGRLKRAA